MNCSWILLKCSQYYSILPILLNITYSISLNIPNPQNCAFPIQYVSIFSNIISHFQYSSILPEQLGDAEPFKSSCLRLIPGSAEWRVEPGGCSDSEPGHNHHGIICAQSSNNPKTFKSLSYNPEQIICK